MIEQFFPTAAARERLFVGPLTPPIEALATYLASQGYAPSSVEGKLRLVAALSRWLHRHQLPITALDEALTNRFLTRSDAVALDMAVGSPPRFC